MQRIRVLARLSACFGLHRTTRLCRRLVTKHNDTDCLNVLHLKVSPIQCVIQTSILIYITKPRCNFLNQQLGQNLVFLLLWCIDCIRHVCFCQPCVNKSLRNHPLLAKNSTVFFLFSSVMYLLFNTCLILSIVVSTP